MSSETNPYAPPKAEVADISGADPHAEAIRQEHIKHESSIKSVGALYYLGGGLMALGAITFLLMGNDMPFGMALGGLYAVLAVLSIFIARDLRRFKPWARVACIVFSGIGLLGFPLGTLINGYILYLMLAQKGRRIFEPDYLEIVAATPHIRYSTPVFVWILVGLLVAAMLAAIAIPMFANR
jgi:hypothetical protein